MTVPAPTSPKPPTNEKHEPVPETDGDGADAPAHSPAEEAIVIGAGIDAMGAEDVAERIVAEDLRLEDKGDLAKRTSRGAGWSLMSSIVVQSSFVVQAFVLPFFLSPADYALWALAYVVAFIGIQMRDLSLGMKVVQDKDRSREDAFRVAFTLESMLGAGGALVIAAFAPILGLVHGSTTLTVLVLALAPSAFGGTIALPQWMLMRDMRFAARGIALALSTMISIACTLWAAISGWGVWSIVVSIYVSQVMLLVLLWPIARIRPGFKWDRQAFRQYLDFGWPLWAASLTLGFFNFVVVNALAMLFDAQVVGYYQRVWTLIGASWLVTMQMASALYPAVVRVGLQAETLRRVYVVVNRLIMTMMTPIAFTLAFFGAALATVWGPEWADFGPYVQVTATFFVFGSLAIDWENYYRAKGNTRPMFIVYLLLVAFLPVFLGAVLLLGEAGIWVAIALVSIYLYIARSHFAQKLLGRVSVLIAVWQQLVTAGLVFGAAWLVASALDMSSWSLFGLGGEVTFGILGAVIGWTIYVPFVLLTQRRLARFVFNAVRGKPTGGLRSLLAS
ncbi:MAG: oligosaccharide flippase family protein [Acidimicrobiia bacterium]|nr:oligosaccharide flippase family protein [Acidimicrobiia bacterium]